MSSRVSLAELIDNDIPLRAAEAVGIVHEVCAQYGSGLLRGIPNATVIRLTEDGVVLVEGPVNPAPDPISAAADLLSDVLPDGGTGGDSNIPTDLRLLLARATRRADTPPFASMNEFSEALARFAAPDTHEVVRALFQAWTLRRAVAAGAVRARDLTISDVRRARRASGLSLDEVARQSGIPVWRLRELEWGYLRNWTVDDRGREELRRYACAAGVDESLVMSVAWPLVESAQLQTGPPARPVLEKRRLAAHRWALAMAAAALLTVLGAVLAWGRSSAPAVVAAQAQTVAVASADRNATLDRERPLTRESVQQPPRAAALHRTAGRPPTTRAPKQSAPPQHKSFWKRELFRIVIR